MILPGRFFFYGTLMAGSGNPVASRLHARLHPLGRATVPGALFAIPDSLGWYPALLPGEGLVHGTLHAAAADFAEADLAAIDAFEDFVPSDPAASLYCRVALPASLEGGAVIEAQVYRYNRALPDGALAIVQGDFAAFARDHALPVFGAEGKAS